MLNDSDLKQRVERAGLLLEDFGRALERLKQALKQPEDEFIRDACIQRFEFCFELAWKSIQSIGRLEGQDCATPRAAFSLAWQAHWLHDEGLWLDMLDARNKTSHTYREKMAKDVYGTLPRFCPSFDRLLQALRSRLQPLITP
jgi:nucleotidyltransferase substrate binding protein (TIGR01987 family)